MKFFKTVLLGLILGTLGCATITFWSTRMSPRYKGVDPQVAPIVKEWLSLAKERGIEFKDTVTIGFTDINSGRAIGVTNYGLYFNEIDLDKHFWANASKTSKYMLVFHELVHSYCLREHTYYDDARKDEVHYKEDREERDEERGEMILNDRAIVGYFSDFCPQSVMYPEILSDTCAQAHYNEYVNEMFKNCNPSQ